MDTGTLIGCTIGVLLFFVTVVVGGHESIASFWNLSSLMIVFGGTAAALFISFPLPSIRKTLLAVRKCLTASKNIPGKIADQIVFFAESARREGLLAQERRLSEANDPFLAEGLNLVVDGLPPTVVENILTGEIEAMQYRHQQSRNILLYCGKCTPAFGMIGTLIGLVLMLSHLEAETVGTGMAVAVLTTFYGLIAAHLVFMPIAEKLKQLHEAEMRIKMMVIRGVLAIQAGEHPRIIQQKLLTFLPPGERSEEKRITAEDVHAVILPMEAEQAA